MTYSRYFVLLSATYIAPFLHEREALLCAFFFICLAGYCFVRRE